MKIDLGMPELLEDLLEIKLEDQLIDFHNNYSCVNISCNVEEVRFSFKADDLAEVECFNQVEVVFGEAKINKLTFPLFLEGNGLCLDGFYRGRIEQDNSLFDSLPDGRCLFYLDFYEGQSLEILAKSLSVEGLTNRDMNISKNKKYPVGFSS